MATKAKRRLKEITFEHDGAHVALTSKSQGYSANGHPYALVMKSLTQETVEKMQQIQVTMELPEFLQKICGMYYSDSYALAKFLGYTEPESETEVSDNYDSYLDSKVAQWKVVKAAFDNKEDFVNVIAGLKEEELLDVLKAQELFEKNSVVEPKATTEEGSTEAVAKAKESDDVNQAKVEPSGVTTIEKQNMDENEVVELQKSLDTTKVELQKALEKVAAFEAAQKEAVIKAKTEKITAVVKDEKHVEAIAKAALSLESDEAFDAFVAALTAVTKSVEDTSLFQEQGASTSEEVTKSVVKSGVAKQLEKLTAK
jgi:hypothetical protein